MPINIAVSFRFLTLNKYQAMTLIREVPDASYYQHPDTDCFIGLVNINEKLANLDELNIFYVRQNIKLPDCDIFINTPATKGKHSITTPKYINQILKHIDCQLTFSFELI